VPSAVTLSMADLLASAVATEKRPEFGPCERGTSERLATMRAALEADLAAHRVHDRLCDKVFTLAEFIRHCAWVDHTLAHVVAIPYVVPDQADDADELDARLRDHGRQGESKTEANQ
jgi:hypothetical protein